MTERYEPSAGHAPNGTYEPAGGLTGRYPMRWVGKKVGAIKAGTPGRVKLIYFGDSYAAKIPQQIAPLLNNAYGAQVGCMFTGAVGAALTVNSSTGTVTDNVADFTLWPSGLTTTLASAGASRTYGRGGGSVVSDTIKVVHANVGGTFKIQVDGVDNTTPTVTSDNSIGITTITVARAAHTVTVVQLSGTPKIITAGFEDSTLSGMYYIAVGQGGIALNSPTTQAWTNWTTFLANLQPDVITFEMKEDSSWLSAALDLFLTATAAGWPNADVVLVQSPPAVDQ